MTEFIAEISSNHNGNLERALALIDQADFIGCAGVKFQYFKADKLWNKDKFPAEYENAKRCELNLDWLPTLSEATRNRNMLFGLSIFDPNDSALYPYVDYFKIASFEANWFNLVKAAYQTGKRLMISTGQINKDDLMKVISKLPAGVNQIDLLHCVSKYPTELKDCNLNLIKDNPFLNGWSDHTVNPLTIYTAIAFGADVIEFHLDLEDNNGWEFSHSWTPNKAKLMISQAQQIPILFGTGDMNEFYLNQDIKYKANPETGERGLIWQQST